MNWKKNYRSFYYKYADDPEDIRLIANETAHLVIDVQKTYLKPKDNEKENNVVLSVFEKGYRYHDKVIRHAKVIVNKK